jgi:regulatory protein
MPVLITKITPQKKRKNRYALFQNERFLIGISQETLLTFGLHVGSTLSENEFNQLKKAEQMSALRAQALRYLSRRAHSAKELKDKLKQKGFPTHSIATAIGEFKEKGYLDDLEFARMFLREEVRLKKNGPLLIKNKLLVKGIPSEMVEEVLAAEYDTGLQQENCRFLAAKRRKALDTLPERKQKERLAAYLKQKGYPWDTCQGVFDILF